MGVSKFGEAPTVSDVANLIGYSRQNAKRLAAALQKNGFVSITRDQSDARALRIALTTKCRDYFKKRDGREIESLEKMFSGFDAELTDGFYRGLVRLAENVETMLRNDAVFGKEKNYDDI